MAKSKTRRGGGSAPTEPSPFEDARNELFQHIIRCAVVGSSPEDQAEWFDQTMKYMEERYPELGDADLVELRKLGVRFVQPPKSKAPAVAGSVTADQA